MPRYYFHLTSGHENLDKEGLDLASLPMARCRAVTMIAEVLCGSPESYWEHECYRVTVADETGLTLFSVEMNSTDSPAMIGAARTSSFGSERLAS
jgi:hypothetical protein